MIEDDRAQASRAAPLYFRRPPDRPRAEGMPNLPALAAREGRWKLLCEYDGSQPQLYDLDADRGETNNVAADHPELVQRLTAAVLAWHRSLPPDNGPAFDAPQ